jgi:hypothetical protein
MLGQSFPRGGLRARRLWCRQGTNEFERLSRTDSRQVVPHPAQIRQVSSWWMH